MVSPFLPLPSPPMQPPGAMMPVQADLMGGPGSSIPGPPAQIVEADYRVLLSEAESNVGPKPPAWYVPGSKPKAEEIQQEAHEQREQHAERVLMQAWMEIRLGMEISSIFASDELWVELKEIEPQASPFLRIMHNAIINFVAAQTVQFTSLAQGMVNSEERAGIEDHLADAYRAWDDQTFDEGEGDLIRVLTADALSGLVAIYHQPDPGVERTGQRQYRVDPKVVFPIFGRDGLDRVYTVYDASYPEVFRDFADGPGGSATNAIQKIARKGTGRGNRQFDMDTRHELVGYWDREYGIVLWNGQVIREWHHKLWRVPWIVGVPNWRHQAGTKSSSSGLWGSGDRSGPRIDPLGISTGPLGTPTRQRDAARTYEPFLVPWLSLADKMEKMQTRTGYGVDIALDPALVWKRASANSDLGVPEVQRYRRGVTEIQQDEELDVLPITVINESFEPWMQLFTAEMQMAVPIPILQGQTVGTQASGNALDAINEMGYTHFQPVVQFMPKLLRAWGHGTLVYKRDWAPAYDPDNADSGFPVPSRSPYQRKPNRLTREMLERAGCYVDCTMSRFSLAGMAAAATTASILDQQLHLGTRRYWAGVLGMSTNPQQLQDDRRDQDMEDAPGFIEAAQVEHLYEEAEMAEEMGDDESLRRILIRAKRVASKQAAHDMALAKMAGMLSAQPEPMEGELPGNAGQPGANPAPYLSAPEMGGATGTEGGAPAIAPAPGQV